jgi:hypothetical protein
MYHRKNVKNASYALVNSTGYFLISFYGFFLGETYQDAC